MELSLAGFIWLAAALWVIYDVLTKQKRMSREKQAIWVILALLFSVITAVVYLVLVKKGKF